MIYREDFQQESGSSTMPELDLELFGGLQAFCLCTPPSALTLDGTSAVASLSADLNGGVEGLAVLIVVGTPLPSPPIVGIRGDFEGLATTVGGSSAESRSGLVLTYESGSATTFVYDRTGFLPSIPTMALRLLEGTSPTSTNVIEMDLGPSGIESHIRSGGAFRIDLEVDTPAGITRASVTADGQTVTTPDLAMELIAPNEDLTEFSFGTALANGGGGDDALDLRVIEIQLFGPAPTAVPGLTGLALAGLSVALLGIGYGATRRRT